MESSLSCSGTEKDSSRSSGFPVRRFILKQGQTTDDCDGIPNEDVKIIEVNTSKEKHSATFSHLNSFSISNRNFYKNESNNLSKSDSNNFSKIDGQSNILNNTDSYSAEKKSFYEYKGKIETLEKLLEITKSMGVGNQSEDLIKILSAFANTLVSESNKLTEVNDCPLKEKKFWMSKFENALEMTHSLRKTNEIQSKPRNKNSSDDTTCFC
jgi:hypothetical protein